MAEKWGQCPLKSARRNLQSAEILGLLPMKVHGLGDPMERKGGAMFMLRCSILSAAR
jgi:hypothetical protein